MAETIKIGGRLHSTATGNIVTGANEILDDVKGKKQSVINAENDAHFEGLDSHATDTDNDIESLDNRIHAVEEHESIMIEGGNLEVVNTGEDIQPGSGAVATGNALADAYGYLVENPEWIYVLLDSQKRILAGLKSDGSVEWSIGVPTPVKIYIDNAIAEIKNGTEGTDLDGLNKIIAFLSEFSTSDTLKDLLDEKVDKEEGKSLIDEEYAEGVHYIENPEFAEVKVDNENRILEAIMKDGTKLLPAGVKVIGTAEYDGATIKTIENPEFAGVWLDNEEHILFGVQTDGNFLFGCGIPRQVKEYIEQKIEELSLDEYESIVSFIGDYLNNTTLEELLSKKVDGEYVDNPEFIEVKVDNEDKILEATEKDGTKLFGSDVKVLGSIDINGVNYKVVNNPEWLKVVLDSEDRIICGIKTDGKFVVYVADFLDDIEVIKTRLKELDAYSVTENPEFMEVELDADDKILGGRKVDGTKFENNDVELNGNATVGGSLEVDGVVIKNIEDPEGRHEITLDVEEKIISYRKEDGTLVENVGIETPNVTTDNLSAKEVDIEGGHATLDSLELTEQGMTEFQQALKDAGFNPGGGGDWTDREVIELPEPKHYALLNIDIDYLPTASGDVREAAIQYYDGLGNSFKMSAEIEIQGQTSRIFAQTDGKGNYTLDLPKDIKFGSWVPQDSFHLKGCAKDVTKGYLATSYKLARILMDDLNARPNRVLSRESEITMYKSTGDWESDWIRDAMCLPDGFPVEIYVNGIYHGLYSWQLKKHRKNYSMNKNDYTSFFIDADAIMTSNFQHGIWNDGVDDTTYRPSSWWTGFDIKGPKDLICMDGSKFDGDNPKELIDSTSEHFNANNTKHVGSQTTKNLIKSFHSKYAEVKSYIDNNDIETAKEKFEEYFDHNACLFVYIFNCTMRNYDSISKNTLWGVYKSGKIAPMLWDTDGVYGEGWIGENVVGPTAGLWTGVYATSEWPLGLFWALYENEVKETYIRLREENIISIETWKSVIDGWVKRIGSEAYQRDLEKWPETPSYRENYTNSEYWEQDFFGSIDGMGNHPLWNNETNYSTGDTVVLRQHANSNWYMVYHAKKASVGICPVTRFYEGFPQVGGFYDSPKRMEKWIQRQIELCDSFCRYNE